ncbi:MAG: aromatic amino acid ammonia-lyase [Rhabdochlamydiaceae bacterium]|nr:aromatic amino acid ammonia-lyase [Candidatus Amphrikana amoebophyrae]
MATFGNEHILDLKHFLKLVYSDEKIKISDKCVQRLDKTRYFIQHLLDNNIKVYGLTTGFADLRDCAVAPHLAAELSINIISSHDAGIGKPFPTDVVLGAMIIRANSLSKGNSGFQTSSLQTLLDMINARVIPIIPETGSLGASGDLANLARLGQAMQGNDVPVEYNGEIISAKLALQRAGIKPFSPKAKEGLALTNGTAFMASMIAIGYQRQINLLNNLFSVLGLFLNSIGAIDASFYSCLQLARKQTGQTIVADLISRQFKNSPFINHTGVQDDYCVRCLPQIFGPRIEIILEQKAKVNAELDAITDNPLLFLENEISADVSNKRKISFQNEDWVVISGGNFHGEILSTIADTICAANAKIALTLERHLTYMLNPFRNKNTLPTYLIHQEEKKGLLSGYMIPQYTANSLAQKICMMAQPVSTYNITSANESEDLVSYGATAAHKLLDQIDLMNQLLTIYLTTSMQAYSLSRRQILNKGKSIPSSLLSEIIFQSVQEQHSHAPFPSEENFAKKYEINSKILESGSLYTTSGISLYNSLV